MNELINKIKKIINEELDKEPAVLVEIIGKSTGVKGDIGLYGYIISISLRSGDDKIIYLPWPILRRIQSRISSIAEISRVLYDLTPPENSSNYKKDNKK